MNYIQRLSDAFGAEPAFTAAEARRLFRRASEGYVNLMLHNLSAKKLVFPIRKGVYSFSSDAAVVGFAFQPFYYGLQEALSLHGLWEQETNPIVITPRKVRSGMRTFERGNFVIRRISRRMFFGFEALRQGELWVPVSTPEKTIIDMVYFNQHIPPETLEAAKRAIDRKEMASFLKKCPAPLARKVSGLLRASRARI